MARIGSTLVALLAAGLILSGCTRGGGSAVTVVAAENFWGSIATQLAGRDATVQSIITNPAEDPHAYEPTAPDARALAGARLVILTGLGYDPWVGRLLAANPVPGRIVLNVGELLGLHDGDNPHRWYSPADVFRVTDEISRDLAKLDPARRSRLDARRARFESVGLAAYQGLISYVRNHYAGTPVGASESIFALLAPALALNLETPPGFMKAISEGTEVTAEDLASTERQITQHAIKVWVYNSQNATPVIERLNALAEANRIPIATVTETLAPAGASFQDWQVAQLRRLAQALARGR